MKLLAVNDTHTFYHPNKTNSTTVLSNFPYKNCDWLVMNRKHAELFIEHEADLKVFYDNPIGSESYVASFLAENNLTHEVYKTNETTDGVYQVFFEDWVAYPGYTDKLSCRLGDDNINHLIKNYDLWVEKNVFFYRKIKNPSDKTLEFLIDKIK